MFKLFLDGFIHLSISHLLTILTDALALRTKRPYFFLIGAEGLYELLTGGFIKRQLTGDVSGLHPCRSLILP